MHAESFAAALHELTAAVPFTPFDVELTNGLIWVVNHPEAVRVGTNGLAYYVERGADASAHFFDADSVFRIVIALGAFDPGTPDDGPDIPL